MSAIERERGAGDPDSPLGRGDPLASRRRPDAPTKFLILEEVRVFQTNHSRE